MQKIACMVAGLMLWSGCLLAQSDTLTGEDAVTVAASKWAQRLHEVPNQIVKVRKSDILFSNPQTAADMLAQTGAVFVQKSQLGGGSPMIRGFATNRVLLVVDGVRMNNAIYRSGNLQNVISIDALATETAEVIMGPGSIVYGSDAIGGVMSFHSLDAKLASDSKNIRVGGSALLRTNTANNELTAHADVSVGGRKLAWMGSVTYSEFGDLMMGKRGGFAGYERPQYVVRVNNRDSVFQNTNPRKQVFSGYEQWNVVQKLRYRPTQHLDLQYTLHHARTGTHPRYDRLIEYRNNQLRFAQWDYGPMVWQIHTLQATYSKANLLFDEARVVAAYQHYEESRIDRQRGNLNRRTQAEQVYIWTGSFDARKRLGKGELFYGLEAVHNLVDSRAFRVNIQTEAEQPVATRYPDGSTWQSLGAYAQYKRRWGQRFTTTTGLRYNRAAAHAVFDKTFMPFPFDEADIRDGALTGNLGFTYEITPGWQIHGHVGNGFRVPNIDDLGKLFESNPGNVVVPNADLKSEFAWNYELGTTWSAARRYRIELNGFYTRLNNAIVRRPFSFNGQDSIVFDGVKSRVEALQNIGFATVYGIQAAAELWLTPQLSVYSMANYITGRETDDAKNEQVPLRHAPPFYGSSGIRWQGGGWRAEAFAVYNSEVSHDNLSPSEQPKTAIYALDSQGRTFSPRWHTYNARLSYRYRHWLASVTWENMTNRQYRPYSSGIVAPGSSLSASLRFAF